MILLFFDNMSPWRFILDDAECGLLQEPELARVLKYFSKIFAEFLYAVGVAIVAALLWQTIVTVVDDSSKVNHLIDKTDILQGKR